MYLQTNILNSPDFTILDTVTKFLFVDKNSISLVYTYDNIEQMYPLTRYLNMFLHFIFTKKLIEKDNCEIEYDSIDLQSVILKHKSLLKSLPKEKKRCTSQPYGDYIERMTAMNEINNILIANNAHFINFNSICNKRLKEGKYINNSILNIKKFINKTISLKLNNNSEIIPNFIDNCLQKYCPLLKDCFQSISIEDNYDTTEIINNMIYNNIEPDNVTMCIFCVLNIDYSEHKEPPTVPYFDINDYYLSTEFEKKKQFIKDKIKEIKEVYAQYSSELNIFLEKTFSSVNNTDPLSAYFEDTYKFKTENINKYNDDFTKILKFINTHNTSSVIGTIDFLDTIAKYNKTFVTCTYDYSDITKNLQEYKFKLNDDNTLVSADTKTHKYLKYKYKYLKYKNELKINYLI
jgi:hypothetical protein